MKPRARSAWTLYIIEAQNGFLYTGITKDLARRFEEHRSSPKSAKFFRRSPPKRIRFSADGLTQSMALRLEHAVKRLSREQKNRWLQTASPKSLKQLLKRSSTP